MVDNAEECGCGVETNHKIWDAKTKAYVYVCDQHLDERISTISEKVKSVLGRKGTGVTDSA